MAIRKIAVGSMSTLVTALLACSGPTAEVSLSARIGPKDGALKQGLASTAPGVDLSRIRVLVNGLSLQEEGDTEGMDGCHGAEGEPIQVDLEGQELEGGAVQVVQAQLPEGKYTAAQFEIGPLEERDVADVDESFAAFKESKSSILIDGTIDGEAFAFASAVKGQQKVEGPFEVKAGTETALTLAIDPASWFVNAAGERMDPRDEAMRAAIEANIQSSFGPYVEEEDHDGPPDFLAKMGEMGKP